MNAPQPTMAFAAAQARGTHSALAQRFLNLVLFITVLTSAIAFIEPSPHDAMIFVLLAMCVAARVPFDRKLLPLVVMLIVWLTGGFLSLIQAGDDQKSIQYMGTSLYLAVATLMFACLFSDGNLRRLFILRRAYILSALVATAAGFVGFFHLLPGSELFADERVRATFKDPNVYGPFLIFPLILLMISLLTRRFRLLEFAVMATLLGGLLLSFSRGAWAHFLVSATLCFILLVLVAPDLRMRGRIITLGIFATIVAALLIIAFISIDSVHSLLLDRARAIQPYDVGPGGRFSLQELALSMILAHPAGMGPYEFANTFGGQQHNVYMQGFLVYGWLGGAAYLTIIAVTLMLGLRTVFVPAPWQGFLIAAFSTLVGEVGEGMIVDTDHWRHFFLLLGLIWGLAAASINWRRRQWLEYDETAPAAMRAAI